jgi:UDP-3-O-[3-hydroxymyristoyl] glucosamine N-acyltransferase
MFGGQVGLGGHITVGDNANVGAQSGIISDIKPNAKIMGAPAIPVKDFFRSSIIFPKLPEMYRQIARLQKEIDTLKSNKQ